MTMTMDWQSPMRALNSASSNRAMICAFGSLCFGATVKVWMLSLISFSVVGADFDGAVALAQISGLGRIFLPFVGKAQGFNARVQIDPHGRQVLAPDVDARGGVMRQPDELGTNAEDVRAMSKDSGCSQHELLRILNYL